jgi:type IV secretion system protein VirB6
MSTYSNFLVNLGNEMDSLTTSFVFDGYNALASLLRAPLGSMLVLYIVLVGYAMVRGVIASPQQELFKFTIRAGLIYMGAMNWGFFSEHLRDLFVVGSETISTTLMKAVHKKASNGSINQGLQDVLTEVMSLGGNLFEMGSLHKLTPYFVGLMVFISGIATIGLAFIEVVIAKLMLAITLATAPLFILFTLFEQTKSFFDRWLGILMGFSLVLVFVSSVVGLCMHLIHWAVAGANSTHELNISIWVPLFIVSCLCVMSILQAASIGKSIGGALCTSGASAMVGGFVGGLVGSSAIAKQAYGKTLKRPVDYGRNKFKQAASISSASRLVQSIRRGGA